jgi:hypothetical protein
VKLPVGLLRATPSGLRQRIACDMSATGLAEHFLDRFLLPPLVGRGLGHNCPAHLHPDWYN